MSAETTFLDLLRDVTGLFALCLVVMFSVALGFAIAGILWLISLMIDVIPSHLARLDVVALLVCSLCLGVVLLQLVVLVTLFQFY